MAGLRFKATVCHLGRSLPLAVSLSSFRSSVGSPSDFPRLTLSYHLRASWCFDATYGVRILGRI